MKKKIEVGEALEGRLKRVNGKKSAAALRRHDQIAPEDKENIRKRKAQWQRDWKAGRKAKDAVVGEVVEPTVNEAVAREWARLIASGVPPYRAAEYISPSYCARIGVRNKKVWASRMEKHPLVVLAVAELNGGEWHHLERERRLQLALDKHLAELAHFLYTHSYVSVYGENAKKMDNAADKLLKYLAESEGDPNSPWKTFVAEFMAKFEKEHDNVPPVN